MATLKLPSRSSGNSFGAVVAAMRQRRKLRQAELARRVGLSASHLSNIEHTRSAPPTEALARRLALALSLSLSETKSFVAEANLARSQWHADRVRSRMERKAETEAGSDRSQTLASESLEAGMKAFLNCASSPDGALVPGAASRPTQMPLEGLAGEELDDQVETTSRQAGAFSIAAQTVRLDIDLPEIGAACLEIDVSTEGSDCRLSMRVVPKTLEQERRP